jgi:PEP-CTERM motif
MDGRQKVAKKIGCAWKAGLLLVAVILSLSLVPTVALADTLNFTIAPTGTISYASGGALVGSSIGVTAIQDTTTGVTYNVVNGALNFTSGGYLGSWSWGAGAPGTLTLSGCISGITGNGNCGTAGGVVNLFSDDFTSAMIFQPYGNVNYQVQLGNITGILDSALAAQFGVSTGVSSALYNTSIDVQGATLGNPFNGFNLGGSISSTVAAGPTQVPEPSSAGLLGFGLIGTAFAMVARRKPSA